jgi:hypothetical protein
MLLNTEILSCSDRSRKPLRFPSLGVRFGEGSRVICGGVGGGARGSGALPQSWVAGGAKEDRGRRGDRGRCQRCEEDDDGVTWFTYCVTLLIRINDNIHDNCISVVITAIPPL